MKLEILNVVQIVYSLRMSVKEPVFLACAGLECYSCCRSLQSIYLLFSFLLNRHYFALPTNPGEQFFMFCTLAAWLITKAGRPFEQPQEYDDPNAVISNILSELRSFVSVEHAVFPSAFQA